MTSVSCYFRSDLAVLAVIGAVLAAQMPYRPANCAVARVSGRGRLADRRSGAGAFRGKNFGAASENIYKYIKVFQILGNFGVSGAFLYFCN